MHPRKGVLADSQANPGCTLARCERCREDGRSRFSYCIPTGKRCPSFQFWPGESPVGRQLFEGRLSEGTACEIVGVVETGKYRTLGCSPVGCRRVKLPRSIPIRPCATSEHQLAPEFQEYPAREPVLVGRGVRTARPGAAATRYSSTYIHASISNKCRLCRTNACHQTSPTPPRKNR
jgi:hypothetical protein